MKRFYSCVMVVTAIMVSLSFGVPEPAVVQSLNHWTINTTFIHPQQLVLRQAAADQPVRYWYTILTLTNNTGDDADFYPKCELMTDTFEIIPAGKSVTPSVYELVRQRHQVRYPYLELLSRTDNKILQGEDNTKDIAVIWPDFDPRAGNITLFITGLSNETTVVEHPVSKDENGEPVKVYLRKTLELSYTVKGDAVSGSPISLEYKGKRWIFR